MKRHALLMILLAVLVFSSFGFINHAKISEHPLLIRIEIKDVSDFDQLRAVPIAAHVRTDEYVIAALDEDLFRQWRHWVRENR